MTTGLTTDTDARIILDLYVNERLATSEIAERLSVDAVVVETVLDDYGIDPEHPMTGAERTFYGKVVRHMDTSDLTAPSMYGDRDPVGDSQSLMVRVDRGWVSSERMLLHVHHNDTWEHLAYQIINGFAFETDTDETSRHPWVFLLADNRGSVRYKNVGPAKGRQFNPARDTVVARYGTERAVIAMFQGHAPSEGFAADGYVTDLVGHSTLAWFVWNLPNPQICCVRAPEWWLSSRSTCQPPAILHIPGQAAESVLPSPAGLLT